MGPDTDAWNWTVDDVQAFFRNSAAHYIKDLPHGRLPDATLFLAALQDNGVDGYTLLTDVDTTVLRDDCHIKQLGQRSAVIRCITKLRAQSGKYAAEKGITWTAPVMTVSAASPPSPTSIEADYQQETLVEDVRGRKRRKLNLSTQTQATIDHSIPKTSIVKKGYLPDAPLGVEEIFFGTTPLGAQIKDEPQAGALSVRREDRDVGFEDDNFQFGTQNKAAGDVHIVNRHMRRFLRESESINLTRGGRHAAAKVPLQGGANAIRSALVVRFQDDRIIVTREDASMLQLDNNEETLPGHDSTSMVNATDEDVLLPIYGESDDEDSETVETQSNIDIDAPMAEEDDDAESEDKRSHAAAVVDQYIGERSASCQQALDARGDGAARKVWKRMKKSVTLRGMLVDSAKAEIDHYTGYLAKMKAYLLDNVWRKDDAIREACSALDVTIDNREEQRWKITVWNRRQEPGHPVKSRSGKRSANVPTASAAARGGPTFVPEAGDRISLSPPPVLTNNDTSPEEEVLYEADDEQFHTPDTTPEPSPGASMDPNGALDGWLVDDDVQQGRNTAPRVDMDEDGVSLTDTGPEFARPASNKTSSYAPESDASAEDELPSASKLVRLKVLSTPHTPIKTSDSPVITKPRMLVDLSNLTSSPSSNASTSGRRGRPRKTPKMEGLPTEATAAEVDTWDYDEVVEAKDRQRLLILLLLAIGPKKRAKLIALTRQLTRPNLQAALLSSCKTLQATANLPNATPANDNDIHLARELYIRYLYPSHSVDFVSQPPEQDYITILDPAQVRFFTNFLCQLVSMEKLYSNAFKSPPKRGSESRPVMISSSSDERTAGGNGLQAQTPKGKGKKPVERNASAAHSRQLAKDRLRRFDESQTTDPARLAAMADDDNANGMRVEINPAREDSESPIYIGAHIASRIQRHQIDGVRFLWREITTTEEDANAQGCVLAHTMGLGKTMQTITLVATINAVAHSRDKSVSSQLPRRLRPKDIKKRRLRVLIISPPALLNNWQNEISKWAPGELGRVTALDSATKVHHLSHLEDWMQDGGVVLIGYQMFAKKISRKSAPDSADDDDFARVRTMLLEGPELVVADEVHNLKNAHSMIAKATAELATESRIGLTGTPMSNNVSEIYAVISFVAPGFLGDEQEFRGYYGGPIERGLYKDSLPTDKRLSTRRLQGLHKEIQPKVNRANIEVLRGSLKTKVEYVITVPLGDVQTELYQRTVEALLVREGGKDFNPVTMFGWLTILTLLTNHPSCFWRKLLEKPKPRKAKKKQTADAIKEASVGQGEDSTPEDTTPAPTDSGTGVSLAASKPGLMDGENSDYEPEQESMHALGFSEEMIASILDGFDNNTDASLSAKTHIFFELLDHSLQCNDKVLVFSSSIYTLDFLQQELQKQKDRLGELRRVDGSVPMKTRTRILEDFHERDDVNIMLISTKAGGVGLNIQGANRVFIFDFGFNPTHEEQAIGRAYRLGQTKPVFVYRFLVGGTFETNIYNKQLFKSSLAQRVIDKKNPRRNAEKMTDYLYSPKEVAQEPLQEWMGKDANVLDRLLARHGTGEVKDVDTMIRAIKTMETLQEEEPEAPLDEEEQRLANEEAEQRRQRPRGVRASIPGGVALAPAATQAPRPPIAVMADGSALPPSTYAGASLSDELRRANHESFGLPMSKQ